jgi:hypothetical protein
MTLRVALPRQNAITIHTTTSSRLNSKSGPIIAFPPHALEFWATQRNEALQRRFLSPVQHRREQSEALAAYKATKPAPYLSEKRAAVVIWISTAVFTLGAMIFGH